MRKLITAIIGLLMLASMVLSLSSCETQQEVKDDITNLKYERERLINDNGTLRNENWSLRKSNEELTNDNEYNIHQYAM
jgi:FtsZ-binding cell division protein ZapB